MRLERLDLRRAPGMSRGLPPVAMSGGLVVVIGPNASGKSTLLRTTRAMLWPDGKAPTTAASAEWTFADGSRTVELHAGRAVWQPPLATPLPPGGDALSRLGLRSLLDDDGAADRDLARDLARELAGGLDLDAAADAFGTPERLGAGRAIARDLTSARNDLRVANAAADALADSERRLGTLADEIAAARAAAERASAAESLLAWHASREELVVADAALAEHPDGLERLHGDEADAIEQARGRLDAREADVARLEREIEEHIASRDAAAFPADPPCGEDVEAWRSRIDSAKEAGREVARLREELAGAEAARDAARDRFGGEPENESPSREALDPLSRSLAAAREAEAAHVAAAAACTAWERWAEGAADDPRPMQDAVTALRAWLRAPEAPEDASPALPGWIAPLLIVLGLLALGAGLATSNPWLVAGGLLAGIGIGLLPALRRGAYAATDRSRAAHRSEVAGTPYEPPRWDVDAVSAHVRDLERRVAALDNARRAAERAQQARAQAETRREERDRTAEALRTAARDAGVGEGFVGLGALERAQALVAWADARDRAADLAARAAAAETTRDTTVSKAASWLTLLGLDSPGDVDAAVAALRAVERRLGSLRDATREVSDRETRLEEAREDVTRLEGDLDALWERSGAPRGDLAEVRRRLDLRTAWSAGRERVQAARGALAAARARYDDGAQLPELAERDPGDVPVDEVSAWRDTHASAAARLDALIDERGRIARELELAREGTTMADALAAVRAAERKVAEERDLALEDAVARALLEEARASHRAEHAPPVLERAQRLFAGFTHDGWALEVDTGGRFCADDVSAGERRSLGQLSDGTRAQLLLAARVAALQGIESPDEPLPLLLDETLSNCDPRRFREVAGALLELVAAGRQVVYVTADPSEAAQWREACRDLGREEPRLVDLGAARAGLLPWGGDLPPVPDATDPVPDPDGRSPVEYARAVGAPAPDGHVAPTAWHLYAAAFDDLDALAACLRRRVTSVGVWRSQRRGRRAPGGVWPESAERIDARCELLLAVAEAWCVGRGRPVVWTDVEASGAVSATFEERVRDILAEHAREPQRFVAEVAALPRFHGSKLDELRAHLESEGVLPTNPPLDRDAIVTRALSRAPAATDALGPEHAAAYVEWVVDLLDSRP